MKYYLAEIEIRCGEYEFQSTIRLQTAQEPLEALKDIARNFYDDAAEYEQENGEPLHEPENEARGHYYFNCGEVCCTVGAWQEIDKTVFDSLPCFISKFTRA